MKNIVNIKLLFLSALFLILSHNSFGQIDSQRILATITVNNSGLEVQQSNGIGDEVITLNEYENEYLKTITHPDSAKYLSLNDRKHFLELYVNFRLKIKDAKARGLLNDNGIQQEIQEYKKNYIPLYLTDREIIQQRIKNIYLRRKEEVRASHILITLAEKPNPEDSVRSYQIADSIIKRLNDGADFKELALQYSMDKTVIQNSGDLYYFTAGMTLAVFENAVYSLQVGEVTQVPVRTPFGLHIIKLTDRKPRTAESVRASHILLQDKRDSTGAIIDSIETYQRSLEIFQKVQDGEDFTELAKQYSEDPGSNKMGGDLGFFTRRRIVQQLDSALFSMNIGDVTGPIRTPYGWHILKKTDELAVQTYERQKENLKIEFKKTKEYKDICTKYADSILLENNFRINEDGFTFLRSKFRDDKSILDYKLDSMFTSDEKLLQIAEFDGGQQTINDLLNYLNLDHTYYRSLITDELIKTIIHEACTPLVLYKKAIELKIEDDGQYQIMIEDYQDGLLVFKIEQDELWKKVKLNDNEIKQFYETNKKRFSETDKNGNPHTKPFVDVKPEISNELQQIKYKEIEKEYLKNLKNNYTVHVNEDVLLEAFNN